MREKANGKSAMLVIRPVQVFSPGGGGKYQQRQGGGSGGKAPGKIFGYPPWISRGGGKVSDPFFKKNYDFKKPVFKAYLNTILNQVKY